MRGCLAVGRVGGGSISRMAGEGQWGVGVIAG